MIEFQKLDVTRKSEYTPLLNTAAHRGCAFSFANLYMWGRQCAALVEGRLTFFSHFAGHSMYPFPMGEGDPKPALDAIIADAGERGIPCRITGLTQPEMETLEALYPGRFRFHWDRDSFDYVYDINDLAELKGRKFQQKRNHLNRFTQDHPDACVLPLAESNLEECREFVDSWYALRREENPHEDIQMEQVAISRAFRHYSELGMEGLVLYVDGRIVAMTMGSFLGENTIDVHFEKADHTIQGCYGAINRAFARYIRGKFPQVRYLNREDDMGLEGLRRAKLSYQPHHMVEKGWALLMEEGLDD